MGIQKDAGEILVFIYQNKIKGNETINYEQLLKITGWAADKLTFALEYLIRKGLVDGNLIKGLGFTKTQSILIRDISYKGIDIVENNKEFQKNFGFSIGIPGVFIFSWGVKEK